MIVRFIIISTNLLKSFLAKNIKIYIICVRITYYVKGISMDMDKYFKELEEQRKNEEKSDNILSSAPTHCPMCSRRCELAAPMCGRGVMFAQQNGIDTQVRHI